MWKTANEPKQEIRMCDFASKAKKEIHIDEHIERVFVTLCDKILLEWQVFLIGEETEDAVYITDYYIPKQRVTSGFVTNLECVDKQFIESKKIVASIHSHGTMDVFFSATDQETNIQEIRWHIVTNNRGEYKAICRIDLPCGGTYMKDVLVYFDKEFQEADVNGFENIEKSSYLTVPKTPYSHMNNQFDFFDDSKIHAFDKKGGLYDGDLVNQYYY